MGILDGLTGGGKMGKMGGGSGMPPEWLSKINEKRAAYSPPPTPTYGGAGGPFGGLLGLLGGAYSGAGVDLSSGPQGAIMQILGALNGKLGGSNPSAPAAPTGPAPATRPAPMQFDPQAYLNSRLGGNTPSYPAQIKLPF